MNSNQNAGNGSQMAILNGAAVIGQVASRGAATPSSRAWKQRDAARRKGRLVVALLGVAFSALSGCASILDGARQRFEVRSQPPGAEVRLEGRVVGRTPIALELETERDYGISVSLAGATHRARTDRSLNVNCLWNLLVPGSVIGVLIDVATGAVWRFDPAALEFDFDEP
jgi:hypothetical protein